MSLDVALQSVAFYVLSCSTCAKISHRRKAKVQAKRERAEKQDLETEQPGLYRHPSPFSTNPFWTEEIMMGPGPPKQKADKSSSKNTSQRALNTAGQGSSYAGSTGMSTEAPSSPTTATEASRLSGDGWNRKRYQREDEALWGVDLQGSGQKIKDAFAKAGSSAGRLLEGRLSKSGPINEENPGPYYLSARNPPVNDLHPPVVSTQPSSRDETRWMLQPPPPAKIMEGKVRVNRSRAGSSGSSMKHTLSRQTTDRAFDAKLQRAETPSRQESRSRTSRSTRRKAHRHGSNRGTSPDSSDDDSNGVVWRRPRPPPLSSPSPNTRGSSPDIIERIPGPQSLPRSSTITEMRETSSRPLLTTIVSSSAGVPKASSTEGTPSQLPLREIPPRSTDSALNSKASAPVLKLPNTENPASAPIPSSKSQPPDVQSKSQNGRA
ncbi:Uncharacterized protein BP5553_02070 [Venustampulla echinocandica]|uniref:Signal peptide-containing protein n=1 Tax=Venustampulla echinocandica TaxID=2656787 RepID=A0A370U2U5_9HELO|nr:Uncharacterized protein BP5553_02070 [Venustampulla echinocandica]RDL42091.1 Uncharacterized protein BP5553_02070 [Venustampulla echinocandica]